MNRTRTPAGRRTRWAVLTIGQQGVSGLSSLIFLVASSTALSLGDRGMLALATSAATIAGTLAPLGMTHAFLHFGGRGFSTGAVVRPFIGQVVAATAVLGVAAAAVFRLSTGADISMTIACGVAVAVYAALQLTQAALYGSAEVRAASLRRSVGSVSLLFGALVLGVADVERPVVWLSVWVASVILAAGLQFASLQTQASGVADRAHPAPGEVRSFCWKAAPLNLSYILAGRVDLWIVGLLLDMEHVAVYSAALGVVEVASVFGQGLASSFQIDADRTQRPPLRQFGLLSATQTVVALLAWGVVSWATTWVFGNDAAYGYAEIGMPLALLAVAAGPLAFQRMYAAWLAGAGDASMAVRSTVVMAGAVALFAWSLTPALGVTGAAVASLLGYGFGAIALVLPDRLRPNRPWPRSMSRSPERAPTRI